MKIRVRSSRVRASIVEGRCGSSCSASVSSETGSSSLSRKPATVPQTVTSRPARSKATVAHSPPTAAMRRVVTSGSRPSGPGNGCVSVLEPSPCMPLRPTAARNGCWDGGVPGTGEAVAGAPA